MVIVKQPESTSLPIIKDIMNEKNGEYLDLLIIPELCQNCGSTNFNIWGVKQNQKLEIKISCMKCGKPSQKIIHNGYSN
jgi:hypothetical protein